MSLANKDFDKLSVSDLHELIAAGVPEGVVMEYKSALYSRGDNDVKEFLKDISSFANTSGGHLVIGMEETGGAASSLAPLSQIDPDKELQRLESLAPDGLEPNSLDFG